MNKNSLYSTVFYSIQAWQTANCKLFVNKMLFTSINTDYINQPQET